MLFTLPEYHHDIHQPLVAGSLWISLAWWVAALLLVLFYPGSAALWCHSKVLRLIFGLLTISPFFWGAGCAARLALRRKPLQRCDLAALCDDSRLGG